MVFIVALCAPWCRHLESLKEITPQLYADNLICSSYDSDHYTVAYVKAVGQEAFPTKCVLLSISKTDRKRMT